VCPRCGGKSPPDYLAGAVRNIPRRDDGVAAPPRRPWTIEANGSSVVALVLPAADETEADPTRTEKRAGCRLRHIAAARVPPHFGTHPGRARPSVGGVADVNGGQMRPGATPLGAVGQEVEAVLGQRRDAGDGEGLHLTFAEDVGSVAQLNIHLAV